MRRRKSKYTKRNAANTRRKVITAILVVILSLALTFGVAIAVGGVAAIPRLGGEYAIHLVVVVVVHPRRQLTCIAVGGYPASLAVDPVALAATTC